MTERIEDTKGRVKEAAGDLTDDEQLQREGKLDQASASAKDAVDKAKDKVGGLADKLKGDK